MNDDPMKNESGKQKGKSMINMARTARLLIKILSGILVLIFGWLKLKGIEIGIAIPDVTADVIMKLSLVAYFTCWVLGTNNDVNDQELVYEKAPNSGVIPPAGYAIAVMLAAVFGGMCYVHSYKTFSILLLLLWIINVIGWYYLVRRILTRNVEESLKQYRIEKLYSRYELLRLVHEYMSGNWQWHRFLVGFAIIVFNIILAYTDLPSMIASSLNIKSPEMVTAVGFITYIAVMETWIWVKRFNVKTSMAVLGEITEAYNIYPIEE